VGAEEPPRGGPATADTQALRTSGGNWT
jgi:hypothetical protein